eukprot:493301-Alexandrium_andersonii.AAC.1
MRPRGFPSSERGRVVRCRQRLCAVGMETTEGAGRARGPRWQARADLDKAAVHASPKRRQVLSRAWNWHWVGDPHCRLQPSGRFMQCIPSGAVRAAPEG